MTTALSGSLRILTGIAVVTTMGYAGFLHRSPWIILLFGVVFTVLYVQGKLPQWSLLLRTKGFAAVALSLCVTYPIQLVLAGVFFLVGYGLGAIVGDRPMATALEPFDYYLAAALLVPAFLIGLIIHALERSGKNEAAAAGSEALSADILSILGDAAILGGQVTAMPIQIFGLARRLADHPDRDEALTVMEEILFDDDNAFVRRVAYTALRFMGQEGRDLRPGPMDERMVKGMTDEAVWVRYDAAWIAGEISGDDKAFAAALQELIADAEEHEQAFDFDEGSAESKTLARARDSLEAVERRRMYH